MKFNIVEEDTGVYGRIEEIPDGEEIATCFICNSEPDPELVGPLKYCCVAHRELHEVDDVDRPTACSCNAIQQHRSCFGYYSVCRG